MKKIIPLLAITSTLLLAQSPTQTVTITPNEQNQNSTKQRIIENQNTVPLSAENVHIAVAQLAGATNANLPQRLDFVTIFDRATAKDKVLKYYYILNDDEDFVLSKFNKTKKNEFLNSIKENVKSSLCSSEMSKNLLNAGASFNYNFELRNGNKYFDFSMDKSVCQ